MLSRLTFLAILIFWVTMNYLLWQSQYGQHGGEISIPLELVWRKILSAPDPSSLSVYLHGERTGYCEINTSVQQEMAKLDADKLPPEGLAIKAGYQLHINGNLSFGDFTNRVKFDGRILFNNRREWQEFHLRAVLHGSTTEIHCFATNQTVDVSFAAPDALIRREFHFADLENPQSLLRALGGDSDIDSAWFGLFELPNLASAPSEPLQLTAKRARIRLGREPVSVYMIETTILGQAMELDVSTIGEILRVKLPNGFLATIDPS
jgi:hypothetical protein